MNFSECLQSLLDEWGGSQKDFAKAAGISPSSVVNYRKGQVPKSEELYRISKFFGVTMEWLLSGSEYEMQEGESPVLREEGPRYAPRSPLRLIPVLGWAHAGTAVDYEQTGAEELVPTSCPDPQAYAVTLEGDSMYPLCDDGDVVVVMPSVRIYSGCYVVARFQGSEGVIFRRLEVMGEHEFLMIPENDRYQARSHRPEEFTWVFPVWGSWTQLWKGKVEEMDL